eukprot:COSAG01_NODE_6023_length_3896_cov_1.483013_3_plen_213_part_00
MCALECAAGMAVEAGWARWPAGRNARGGCYHGSERQRCGGAARDRGADDVILLGKGPLSETKLDAVMAGLDGAERGGGLRGVLRLVSAAALAWGVALALRAYRRWEVLLSAMERAGRFDAIDGDGAGSTGRSWGSSPRRWARSSAPRSLTSSWPRSTPAAVDWWTARSSSTGAWRAWTTAAWSGGRRHSSTSSRPTSPRSLCSRSAWRRCRM